MRGATMIATLQWLGVVPSFSRPHVSDDNPYSEALFRTLKHTPVYPRHPSPHPVALPGRRRSVEISRLSRALLSLGRAAARATDGNFDHLHLSEAAKSR